MDLDFLVFVERGQALKAPAVCLVIFLFCFGVCLFCNLTCLCLCCLHISFLITGGVLVLLSDNEMLLIFFLCYVTLMTTM